MDANNLLCWIVGLASLGNTAALLVVLRLRGSTWYLTYGLNAFVLTVFLVFRPDIAGFLSAPFFALTALMPQWLMRLAATAASKHRFGLAYRLVQTAAVLHPFGLFEPQARLLEPLWRLDNGDEAGARVLFTTLAEDRNSAAADFARAQLLRLDGNYEALRAFIESDPGRRMNPSFAAHHMRAVCETGNAREITDALASHQQRLAGETLSLVQLAAAAALGRISFVETLISDGTFAEEAKRFWRASVRQAAGRDDEARVILTALRDGASPAMRIAARQRLERPLRVHAVSDEQNAWLLKLEAETIATERPRRWLTATTALVLANVIMFAIEIPGDVRSNVNLYRLGALVIPIPALSESWRLLTACFLHYGWLHLGMNMVGLWLFGPVVERALGTPRFLVLYLGAGVSSMAAYSAVATLAGIENVVAGASGCIMGLIGGLLGVTLGEWLQTKSRALRQRMLLIVIIFAGQTVFDVFTPHIAMFVHDAGALIGFVLGLLLRRKDLADG